MKSFIIFVINNIRRNSLIFNFLKRFIFLRRIIYNMISKKTVINVEDRNKFMLEVNTNGIIPGSYTVEQIMFHSKIEMIKK